jgi:hypothetical protein
VAKGSRKNLLIGFVKTAPDLLGRLWARVFLISVLGIFCAAAIHKASLAVAPPVYDAVSYYWKAITSLRAIQAGEWFTLMGTEPSLRPPGFLLLNGIFGIDRDVFNFRGFLALNMILPVLLWSAACWVAIPLRARNHGLPWRKSIMVASLALLPMFLQFEYDETIRHASYWGLQDTVLAATAGLSIAFLLRSQQTMRLFPCMAGFALAGFSILIKPAGVLVMLCASGVWCAESLLRCIFSRNALRRRKRLLYFAKGIAVGLPLQAAFLLVAVFSPYLSKQIIQASLTSQAVVLDLMQAFSIPHLLGQLMLSSIGPVWALVFLVSVTASVVVLLRRPSIHSFLLLLRVAFGVLIFAAAACWWLLLAGPVDRYMLPFVAIPIVLALPACWFAWNHAAPKKLAIGISGSLCAIACLQAALVSWPLPVSKKFQEALGVSLGTGGHADSVAAARFIVASSQNLDKPVVVLRLDSHYSLGFIGSWLLIQNLESGEKFQNAAPFEWKFDNVFSRAQVLSADFIVMDKSKALPFPKAGYEVVSFDKEVRVFTSWIAVLDQADGVAREAFGDIEVLRVADRTKLAASFDKLVHERGYHWRDEFVEVNADAFVKANARENETPSLSQGIPKPGEGEDKKKATSP